MADSPFTRAPLDPTEQPILDRILQIRDQLSLLKQDRSTYIRSEDVVQLYNEIIEQVERLNEVRTSKRGEQNRGTIQSFKKGLGEARWLIYNSRYRFG